MKLVICIDKNNGITLMGKRLSSDKTLRDKIIEMIGDAKFYVSSYTAQQFSDYRNRITIDDNYLNVASNEDYCFIEDGDFSFENSNEIILCNWNRKYLADRFLDFNPKLTGYKKVSAENIVGNSHDKITVERYVSQ